MPNRHDGEESGVPLDVRGCILNAFFLYKRRELKAQFEAGRDIKEHIGFDGFVMTDSGAYQGFTRRLHLDNRKIVAFQDLLGADVISPLDLVTPPGDNRTTAEGKLRATLKRVKAALSRAERTTLAGVQQGGRFLDLRRASVEGLMELDIEYLALGSLVPFFNKNHDLGFVVEVIEDARRIAGPEMPIHVYGAGDPVEIPFLFQGGVDIFDSASYGHYAEGGWFMTPYGAFKEPGPLGELLQEHPDILSPFAVDFADRIEGLLQEPATLAAHNLWTILETFRRIRNAVAEGRLDELCSEVATEHQRWFPDSGLADSVVS